jgi:hypothetical protein
MTTADEYHRYARECLQWASEAKTEEQRANFFAMARTWMQAALQMAGAPALAEPAGNPKLDEHL